MGGENSGVFVKVSSKQMGMELYNLFHRTVLFLDIL